MKINITTKQSKSIILELYELKRIVFDYLVKNNIVLYDDIGEPWVLYDRYKEGESFAIGMCVPIKEKVNFENNIVEVKELEEWK
jgi:hypothetical protein